MAPKIILDPSNKFTVLDNLNVILAEVSKQEVEDYFIAELRARFWDMAYVEKVDQLELDLILGRIVCCDCGGVVTRYVQSWKPENQRCEKCKS